MTLDSRLKRRLFKPFFVILPLLSSCLSYRLNYIAELVVHPKNPASIEPDESVPTDARLIYKYGENYSRGLESLGCLLTFPLYGGLCWIYLFPTSGYDRRDLEKKALKNLDQIFNDQTYHLISSEIEKTPRIRDISYYLLTDANGKKLKQGQPIQPNTNSTRATKAVKNTENRLNQDKVSPSYFTFRGIKAAHYRGNSVTTTSIVNEYGTRKTIASGNAKFRQTILEFHEVKPDGLHWGVMPSYVYRHLNIADFSEKIPDVQVKNTDNIPAVVSNPQTRENIRIEDFKNSYVISSHAGALFAGANYNTTGGILSNYKGNIAAVDLGIWVGIVEYFVNELRTQTHHARKHYIDFGSEIRADTNFYYVMSKYRLALGFHAQMSHVPKLRLPHAAEFRGPPRYEETKQVYERPRIYAEHVRADSFSAGLSLTYLWNQME